MRISTITNWAYGATVCFTLASGAAFLLASQATTRERVAISTELTYDRVVDSLNLAADRLSGAMQRFAATQDESHAAAYARELRETRTREDALEKLERLGMGPSERALLKEADTAGRALLAFDEQALAAGRKGDWATARAVVFGAPYHDALAGLDRPLAQFEMLVDERTHAEVVAAETQSNRLQLIAKIMLAATAALFLGVLYFVISRRITRPLIQMSGVVSRLAEQDYAADLPDHRHSDEIGDMTLASRQFRQNGMEREQFEAERQRDQTAKDNLSRMLHRMQGCETPGELGEVVACFAPQIFPQLAGSLFVHDETRGLLIAASDWQAPAGTGSSFAPSECWGLRRGHAHVSSGSGLDVACQHYLRSGSAESICVPLMAQGDIVGLLYLEEQSDDPERDRAAPRLYLDLMAENIGLALANIRLRLTLRALAIRDPLTGLYNRRHLDTTLHREEERARLSGGALACVMMDVDHFKHFNDNFGHDAGDAVLKHVAQIVTRHCPENALAYRYGGEEFTLLLPGADAAQAVMLAEEIRIAVREVTLAHRGRTLDPISASFGVAAFPALEATASLLQAADAALLNAKQGGRDRVVNAAGTAKKTAA
jgi:diguanylate cyclase (GGDEF)-like protein